VAVAAIVDQAQQGLLAGFRQGWYGCLGRRADGWLSSPMRCCARPDRWARCRSCAWSRGLGVALVDSAGRRPSDPANRRSGAGDRRAGSCAGPAAGGDAAPTAVTAIPLLVFDAGDDPIALTCGLAEAGWGWPCWCGSAPTACAPPTRPGGRPGPPAGPASTPRRVGLQEPASWPAPDDQLAGCDARYRQVTVAAWAGLHPNRWTRGRLVAATVPPVVRGTVIGVQVSRLPTPTGRLKVLWLWWAGPEAPDLDPVWRADVRRFDIEHTLRFCTQTLGWVTPRVAPS
jgi:hypothetical protein